MAKKSKIAPEMLALLDEYDPIVRKLAWERANSRIRGGQLFDSRTHRLKAFVRDVTQAIAILTLARRIADFYGFELRLSSDEKRLLNGFGTPNNASV